MAVLLCQGRTLIRTICLKNENLDTTVSESEVISTVGTHSSIWQYYVVNDTFHPINALVGTLVSFLTKFVT